MRSNRDWRVFSIFFVVQICTVVTELAISVILGKLNNCHGEDWLDSLARFYLERDNTCKNIETSNTDLHSIAKIQNDYRGGLQGLARNISGLSTFFILSPVLFFPQKFVAGPLLQKNGFWPVLWPVLVSAPLYKKLLVWPNVIQTLF